MLHLQLIVCRLLCQIIADCLLCRSCLSTMTTALPLSALVIMRSFRFASSSITIFSLSVNLEFNFFGGCSINALISFSKRSIYVCIVYCVSFGVHFSIFLFVKDNCSFGWFMVAIPASSLKWALILISQKKLCESENWFLLYLLEVGMKLRLLFGSLLYVSKEHFVTCRRNYFVTCRPWFCLNNLIWFLRSSISLSVLIDVCFVLKRNLVGDFPQQYCVRAGCNNSSFFKIIGGSSWMLLFLGCLK